MEELQKEKRELVEKKEELLRENNVMQRKLVKIESLIRYMCEKSETGHMYIEEIEEGMYGMTFTYCKICGHEVI